MRPFAARLAVLVLLTTMFAGRLADLAVLSKDFMTVPAGEIGGIESLLTMVGGRIVYAAGPFAALEDRRAVR